MASRSAYEKPPILQQYRAGNNPPDTPIRLWAKQESGRPRMSSTGMMPAVPNQLWAGRSPRNLSDLRPIYCAGGKSGPLFPGFSWPRPTMRPEIGKNGPRSPSRLTTIAQVRQAPRDGPGQPRRRTGYRYRPAAIPETRPESIAGQPDHATRKLGAR